MSQELVTLLATGSELLPRGVGEMREPDEVSKILYLHEAGWGTRQISKSLGISRNTVRKYIRAGKWVEYQQPQRLKKLDGLDKWLHEKLLQHAGNADVIRQELRTEKNIDVSLRTVERSVAKYRMEQRALAEATIRFETLPGQQMQIDFGEKWVDIGGERVKVHLFTAVLGYSRRLFIKAFRSEVMASWFTGIEEAFWYFGGITEEILIDNPKSLVKKHDRKTRELELNEKFRFFSSYWGFRPIACAPSRARTKGKVENGVGYGKGNCIAGRRFSSWEEMEGHIERWMREVGDERIHDTTGEKPSSRFERDERCALSPLNGRAPFVQKREVMRKIHNDATVEVDRNRYSVPWKLVGQDVSVHIFDGEVVIFLLPDFIEIARHAECIGKRQRVIAKGHLEGIIRSRVSQEIFSNTGCMPDSLVRSLSIYDEAVQSCL